MRIRTKSESCEHIIYMFFSSTSSNDNVKDLSASMSLLNSPIKSGYVNITFVFDASTLSYFRFVFSHANLDYWLSSILCFQNFLDLGFPAVIKN